MAKEYQEKLRPPEFITVYEYKGIVPTSFKHEKLMGIWQEAGYSFLFFRGDLSQEPNIDLLGYGKRHVFKYTDWIGGEFKPFCVGRFSIRPVWEEGRPGDLVLDPSVVFGSGLHPTTYHCLGMIDWIESLPTRAMDLGTGTGILAIALAKRGAHVIALDNNPLCVEVAKKNISINGLKDKIEVLLADLMEAHLDLPELVVANLGPVPLRKILKQQEARNVKIFIISGITRSFVGEFQDLLKGMGFSLIRHLDDGIWHTFMAERMEHVQ